MVTLRVKELVEKAEVVVFDYLCNPEILKWAPRDAEIIYAGKKAGQHTLKQPDINALLVEKTAAGKSPTARRTVGSASDSSGRPGVWGVERRLAWDTRNATTLATSPAPNVALPSTKR